MTTSFLISLVDAARAFHLRFLCTVVFPGVICTAVSAEIALSDRNVVGTMAGGREPGGSDGNGIAARFDFPAGIAVDADGYAYVADSNNQTIRKLSPSGNVTTLAGNVGGFGAGDGVGRAAQFSGPQGLAIDQFGQIYVADTNNQIIRKISPQGIVTTFAGTEGVTGARDGVGAEAQFDLPAGLAVDAVGNVYVADSGNQTIRKISPQGIVTTFAGVPGEPGSTDGEARAARFSGPQGVAVDATGNVYVADANNHTIRKISPQGDVVTVAGEAGSFGSEDGTGAAARFYYPFGVAVDEVGVLYVADLWNSVIRRILPSGSVSTLAGSPGDADFIDAQGSECRFAGPRALTVTASGDLLIADTGNNLVRKATTVKAPRFVTQPQGRIVAVGETAVLSAEIIAANPVRYSWRKDGIRLPGVAGATLVLSAVSAADEGVYTVEINSDYGSIASAPVEVRIANEEFFARAKFDLLWSNSATGERALWLMDGTDFLFSFSLGKFPAEWSVAARGDFNGDGYLDIVWSNSVTGERALWLMQRTLFLGSSTLGIFPLEWTVAATGDFNQDAKCDIVWSNSLTGERAVWLMDGTRFLRSSTLGVFPLEWTVVATGDFDGDRSPDLVWSNSLTAERAVWLMDGVTYKGSSTLGIFPLEWTVVGAGDFNGDNKQDLIWSNAETGERAIWFMDRIQRSGVATLGFFSTAWTIRN